MRTEKILHRAIAVLSAVIMVLTGCGQTEETVTETAPETAIVTTTTAAQETTLTTLAETTILTTTAETTPPETEPTTTASITTADNSSDTRSTEKKLSDIIAANPNVEIGYALFNTDTNKYLFHYNEEMEIDPSGEIPPYYLYIVLDQEGLKAERVIVLRGNSYEPTDIYLKYEEGQLFFTVGELVESYFYNNDSAAREGLLMQKPFVYENIVKELDPSIRIENRHGTEKCNVTQFLAQWIVINKWLVDDKNEADVDNIDYLKKLLSNTNRNSYFYEGTGIQAVHSGNKNGSQYYDTGVVTVNSVDYIYVIYTKNAKSADIVREISLYFYDDLT
jgi:hypothetical protein